MIDIKFLREHPELVKENMLKKYQNEKVPLVDEVLRLDTEWRNMRKQADNLRAQRNKISENINGLLKQGKKEEAQNLREEAKKIPEQLVSIAEKETRLEEDIKKIMMIIPNIIHGSVPLGKSDKENKELEVIGKPKKQTTDIKHHAEIMEALEGLDLDSSRKTSGQGFYFLKGDIARLHSALLTYAKDYMIEHGYTFCVPPFMIRSDVVTGVMSFKEMDAMMYKIEGEDLYLIGTSEHSMIGMYQEKTLKKGELPQKMTSYSPCFRKEKGAHGLEERGVYRVHQFEKQEMIVICEPEESYRYFDEMLNLTVNYFKSLDIPVRKLECCSGDLADLKAKSIDVEAWSPRQQKYFEVGSCSNLTDAQARRLGIKINGPQGNYHAHTLNNTVVATPRALIAFIENNYNKDGSITIPKILQPYMGGKKKIIVEK